MTWLSVALVVAAAYAIVRGRFPGRDAIQTFLLSPLIVLRLSAPPPARPRAKRLPTATLTAAALA